MRRILWVSALVLSVSGVIGGIGDALAGLASPSTTVSQRVAGNGVTVGATLLDEQSGGTAVTLTLDTYFVNLVRYDLGEVAVLRDDTGKTYPVTAVEQIGSRKPHYRQAILRFAKVAPEAKTIELVVKDVAGIKERTFHWNTAE
ncbi:MAG TPA: hypothetical protein VF579_11580 [Candidatus Methylomirabilis sp.]